MNGPGPFARNPISGRRHPISWFMFRLSIALGGREVRLPFTSSTWKVTDTDPTDRPT